MTRLLLVLLMAATVAGCSGESTSSRGPVPAAAPPSAAPASSNAAPAAAAVPADDAPVFHLHRAQPRLSTVKLWVGPHEVEAELARTLTQIATGLMFRPSIGPQETMLFVFGSAQPRAFYMKNVPFDIAVAYLDPEGVIQEIVQLKAQDQKPVPSRSDRIQYVLEAAPDWFQRHGVGPGTLIRTDKGSFADTLAAFATLP
ncbi:MAG: DUF192 domain-containing protein [Verrucomicrobiota bacterium]